MADDWAVRAARIAAEQDRQRELNLEKNARDAKLKDSIGDTLFTQLHNWIDAQVKQFNSLRNQQELTVQGGAQPNLNNQLDSSITVRRSGVSPLVISYARVTHSIIWKCGATADAELKLVLTDDGQGHFETPYQVPKSPEELGEEMLNKLLSATI